LMLSGEKSEDIMNSWKLCWIPIIRLCDCDVGGWGLWTGMWVHPQGIQTFAFESHEAKHLCRLD
jgi:hypothetical protein